MRGRDSGIPSVWDVVPDDGELYREVFQEHFGSTHLQVIAVFKVCALAPCLPCADPPAALTACVHLPICALIHAQR